MGYEDHSGRRAVEHFMQDYFRHATRVGELTRIFLTELEARHVKKAPAILGFLRGRRAARRSRTATRSSRTASRSRTRKAFFADKLNMLRLFEEALRTGLPDPPRRDARGQARLDTIDDAMRRDPEAVRIFLDLLLKHGNPNARCGG
jgi:[protein-PII] uridylyltransferase